MSMTAKVLHSGDKYYTDGRIARVPPDFNVVLCEVCGDAVRVPMRLGARHLEEVRVNHLEGQHSSDIASGRAVV